METGKLSFCFQIDSVDELNPPSLREFEVLQIKTRDEVLGLVFRIFELQNALNYFQIKESTLKTFLFEVSLFAGSTLFLLHQFISSCRFVLLDRIPLSPKFLSQSLACGRRYFHCLAYRA
jgi:hypothetical protein